MAESSSFEKKVDTVFDAPENLYATIVYVMFALSFAINVILRNLLSTTFFQKQELCQPFSVSRLDIYFLVDTCKKMFIYSNTPKGDERQPWATVFLARIML